ncbi:MAG TPA: glutathione S-transferase family protein [Burkholderiales bacterium]
MSTAPLTLVIGNKNYSSWSMRPWLAMTKLGIPFSERMLKFDSGDWATHIGTLSPSGLVPVLWEGAPGTGFATWDTLAIAERLHELFPKLNLWPADAQARARARSLCADFHAGYSALRGAMPVNLRSSHPGKGMNDAVAAEIARLCANWTAARKQFGRGGDFLFGAYCAADAFFAPVASRFVTYGVKLDGEAKAYQSALLGTRSYRAWREAALKEPEFVARDEPYAKQP